MGGTVLYTDIIVAWLKMVVRAYEMLNGEDDYSLRKVTMMGEAADEKGSTKTNRAFSVGSLELCSCNLRFKLKSIWGHP